MFTAKTTQSGKLKAIFEVLFSNMSTVCVVISADGLSAEMQTTNNSLIKLMIPSSSFDEYTFTYPEPRYIGLGSHLNTYFKSFKNKTTVVLSMIEPYILDIAYTDEAFTSKCSATVEDDQQHVSPAETFNYTLPPVYISCANFNAMCKSFTKLPTIDVVKQHGKVSFMSNFDGITSKTLIFGHHNEKDTMIYHKQYKSDAFVRISKLSSYADGINLYVEQDKPIHIEAKSSFGTVSVYMN